ncbi:asparagine synthase (glutamine-hydrolyzing) [Paraglaciecola aquimarina]|uniref:asparagine synthase (glutamine-hydrolyzing) n=1 Tax=Paraglaciecola algarum TaxID=3050085 RepID=A0ABS9D5P3_9ALTE|nr:asparagine synthase (glutamine-hydrolyzing) [Paraglaciecola sp. G1-23]MCF2947745.1 asparagine synthase (glutamine-hydrolyzing) [Paraglaciecola sp. G1-23]
MCGIAGFTHFLGNMGDKQTLKNMGDSIYHRGPDAGAEYIDDCIGLAHRRLAIIDLSEAGVQPMTSHDGRYIIVFNGEIYNYQTIRDELSKQGYPFKTHTDTEVILALYASQGEKMLAQLNGMFTFALWDTVDKTLMIARDRMGKKPLYYLQTENQFAFASEIKALLTLPNVPKDIRLDAVHDFFAYQYIPDPKTIFTHIHKLPPGHFMMVSKDEIKTEQYWDVSFAHTSNKSEKELTEELYALATEKTKDRMVSDVPLGAFLSGGIDSSGVVAMMAKNSDTQVKTCSIGFDDKKFNETEFAQVVADQYNTEHFEFTVHQNVKDNLEHIVSFFDEPFADPSLVPTYFVSELARSEVTVAIAGDGGDEVFAGYEKYTTDDIENRLRNKFPTVLRKKVFPSLANLFAKSELPIFRKAKSLFYSLSLDPAMGFYVTNSQIEDRLWSKLANQETLDKLGSYHPSGITVDTYNMADGKDHLSKILYTDMKTYLPGGILVKVDRMSMANSLEVRAPLLDKEVVEFSATLPSSLKFNNGEKKYILKETFKPVLPHDILYRKKMGFSVPLATWLRGEIKDLTQEYLFIKSDGIQQFFNMDVVKELWQQHQQSKADHSTVLWSMLMFQMWWFTYIQQPELKVLVK